MMNCTPKPLCSIWNRTLMATAKTLIASASRSIAQRLLPDGCAPGRCRQDFLLRHQIKCRIGLAQELFNGIAVLRADSKSHADRELWYVVVIGHVLADASAHLVGLP